ncbi:5078_t:CDS:10 [Ambispora leptoticha]|uniref:5078_t:CDS:1 n=1 Tax=Ambispora leptoticha TaxID=144679 RepID=A0A9N8V3D1_9GLOM|nr:5078_t:CDS:10 [Ambispora leptoticha]
MGMALSCVAMPAVSWVGSILASCFSAAVCSLGCKSCNCNNSIATRVGFAIIFLLNSMLAWLMLSDWAIKKLESITYEYLKLNCPEGTCYGVLAVHRICFALSLFHFLLGILVTGVYDTRDKRASIQNGWWGPKILLWITLLIASFFIPNEFFMFWGNYVALIGGSIFILFGLVLLVDFAHSWAEMCLEKSEEDDNDKWKNILIGSTLGMFLGAIVLTGLMYGFFAGNGCSLNQFFITFNFILCLIVTVTSVHPSVQEANSRSGLSQASMVVIYATYVILSAVANEPDDQMCNPLTRSRGTRTTTIVLGALFTFLALAFSTSRAATQGKALITKSDYLPLNTVSAVPLTDQPNDSSTNVRSDALLAAVESDDELVRIGQSYTAVWVKVVSSWLCLSIYAWTLLGPVFFPERFVLDEQSKWTIVAIWLILAETITANYGNLSFMRAAPDHDNKPENLLLVTSQQHSQEITTNGTANSKPPANLKPCCACPDTKRVRDECIFAKGEEHCKDLIEAHKACMRSYGFNV